MKKTTLISIVFLTLAFYFLPVNGESAPGVNPKNQVVVAIENFPNMYQWGNLYLSGQPSLDALQWIKEQGVQLIINLRTDEEMDELKKTGFDEEKTAGELGFKYTSVPVGGNDGYSPDNLLKFKDAMLASQGKVLIHCRSCGRVSYFLMGYLVKYKGFSFNEAISIGKQLNYSFLLEDLLGEEISMSVKNQYPSLRK